MPTESQFISNQSLDYTNWSDDIQYEGSFWSDYIRRGSYDSLYAGSFELQVLLVFAYARSWALPPTGHLYTFPIEPSLPADNPLVNPRILNIASGMIDGGTWEIGSVVRVFWEGDNNMRAFRDYRVKQWNTAVLKSRHPAWIQRISNYLASAVAGFTPTATSIVFDVLQSSTIAQMGYWDEGGITTRAVTLSTDATNPIGSGNGNGNGNGDTGLAKFIPWIIGGIVLFGGVL